MSIEKKCVKLIINKEKIALAELTLFEEVIDDEDMVRLELRIENEKISCKNENFFYALKNLRKKLEKKDIQIICNGAAKNIYPSTMQLSMGTGRVAYKLFIGERARQSHIVDIFDYDEDLQFVTIEEQHKYYLEWLKSIIG